MEKEPKDKGDQYLIYTDILAIFKLASDIQWKEVRQNSVYRILYLSSVLYSFRHPEKSNPFSIYKFTVDTTGPYDSNISKAFDFLIKDEYIKRTTGDDVFAIGKNSSNDVFKIEIGQERYEWLKQVMYILGIYGENKIYDFIFRDPQYQTTIKSNTQQGLNTDINNETIKTLKNFQEAFEETLKDQKEKLSPQTYLELYFEYIFSKILKRED
ncbi:MAG: hypothetical protein CVU43_13910 [Chloroflexi bacterium HGW-Chloroflexi-5]|jgi:hypothetical protein|nr:MAG: hypothetical protein CVU43_13910 [Chloroflexi bacterium HGW-Chloroflexi-5]